MGSPFSPSTVVPENHTFSQRLRPCTHEKNIGTKNHRKLSFDGHSNFQSRLKGIREELSTMTFYVGGTFHVRKRIRGTSNQISIRL